MGILLLIIIICAAIWGYYKYLKKDQYRVAMTDPITDMTKYLMNADGINNEYVYTPDPKAALIFTDEARARKFLTIIGEHAMPFVEIKKVGGWVKI